MVTSIEAGKRTIVPLPGEAIRTMRQGLNRLVREGNLTPEDAQSLAEKSVRGLNVLYVGGTTERADKMAKEMQRLENATSAEPFRHLASSVEDVLEPLGTIVDQRV